MVVRVDLSAPMSSFASTILNNKKYTHEKPSGNRETWSEVAKRQVGSVVRPYLPDLADKIEKKIEERKFIPGGRYLYAAGRKYHQVNSCFLFSVEDHKEGWGELAKTCFTSLMTGGGIGVVYSKLRCEGTKIEGMGGESTGPLALMRIINEGGRYIVQGGSRRAAMWAGLHWNHKDVMKFIHMKDWSEAIRRCKTEDYSFAAPMDGTNISVILDSAFFDAYNDTTSKDHTIAHTVYWEVVRQMLKTGEPGFSIDSGDNEGEHLRNACCEVTSSDNLDMCNLGSINLGRIETIDELFECVDLATAFLICGTLYSKLPIPEMYAVREKNRRLGLGLMGLHEWLLQRGKRYDEDSELGKWLEVYKMSGAFANRYADKLSISRPIATRSIAPNGTISIIGETSSGIEPITAVAYKRRYLDGGVWKAQYVADPVVKRLIDTKVVDPNQGVEDSFTLAEDVGRRMAFQAWIQGYVDHGISSTINLPEWGSASNNESTVTKFGNNLLPHLPNIRGATVYPNGARSGQPITRVEYAEAERYGIGQEFVDGSDSDTTNREQAMMDLAGMMNASCKSGVCGE